VVSVLLPRGREPGEPERLKEEHGLTARLLEFLEADERGELD
jgi:hypothetical protein